MDTQTLPPRPPTSTNTAGLLTEAGFKPHKKPNTAKRIAAVVVLAVAGGVGVYYVASHPGPTPDDKAATLAAEVADDVVTVVSGIDDGGVADARISVAVNRFNRESGCRFIAGTAVYGNTRAEAATAADDYILEVWKTDGAVALGDDLGLGYAVVETRGLIKGEKYAATIAGVDCTPAAQPSSPFGG